MSLYGMGKRRRHWYLGERAIVIGKLTISAEETDTSFPLWKYASKCTHAFFVKKKFFFKKKADCGLAGEGSSVTGQRLYGISHIQWKESSFWFGAGGTLYIVPKVGPTLLCWYHLTLISTTHSSPQLTNKKVKNNKLFIDYYYFFQYLLWTSSIN